MKWNEIESIVPKTNKWYLVKFAKDAKYRPTYAPYVAIQWTGTNWYDGSASYKDLTGFTGWVDLEQEGCFC